MKMIIFIFEVVSECIWEGFVFPSELRHIHNKVDLDNGDDRRQDHLLAVMQHLQDDLRISTSRRFRITADFL
jgi:hypothetical protein